MSNTEIIIGHLQDCKEECLPLAPTEEIRLRLGSALDRLINGLKHMGNHAVHSQSIEVKPATEPLTHVLGTRIRQQQPVKKANLVPKQEEITGLQQMVLECIDEFPTMGNKELKETYGERVLRGVGNKIGMTMTPTEPEKITAAIIEDMRALIVKNSSFAAASVKSDQIADQIKAQSQQKLSAEDAEKLAEQIIKAQNGLPV